MSLYLGENLISGSKPINLGVRNIGEVVASAIPLTDAGLHLLDGSLILGGGIYQGFVDYIANIVSIYPDVFTTESAWQQSVTTYGACDKYVYDSVNNTVRIPKRNTEHGDLIKSYKSGTSWYRIYSDGWCEQGGVSQSAGDQTTNTVNLLRNYTNTNYSILFAQNAGVEGNYTNGCTAKNKNKNSFGLVYRTGGTASFYWNTCGYTDISDYQYSPIYEYIVIATTTKTDIQIDIDEIATDLNGKADRDGSNMVNSVKNFDGQWVNAQRTLSTSTSAGTHTVDLSSYLPNDGYNYDVKLKLYCYSNNSGDTNYYIASDILTSASTTNWGYTNSNNRSFCNTFDMPVGSDRWVKLGITTTNASTIRFEALGYRRIGTNQ